MSKAPYLGVAEGDIGGMGLVTGEQADFSRAERTILRGGDVMFVDVEIQCVLARTDCDQVDLIVAAFDARSVAALQGARVIAVVVLPDGEIVGAVCVDSEVIGAARRFVAANANTGEVTHNDVDVDMEGEVAEVAVLRGTVEVVPFVGFGNVVRTC